jgi:hypothetical protein
MVFVAAGTVLRSLALYDSPRPGYREASLVTQVVEFTRFGVHGTLQLGELPVYLVSMATPQLAALCALTGAWGRAPSALGAVRECGPLLWLAVAPLVWVLARRTGLGRGWALCAVAVLALSPTAIAAARQATPENLAALWALAAVLLALGSSSSSVPSARLATSSSVPSARLASSSSVPLCLGVTLCMSIAVLSSPVAVALLPTVLLLCARQGGRQGDYGRVALVAGAVLFVSGLGAATALATASPSTLTANVHGHPPDWFGSDWLGPDLITPLLGLVGTLLALRGSRLRPIAIGVLLLPLVGALFGAPVAAFTVPLASVLAVQAVAGVLAGRTPTGRRHRHLVKVAMPALLAGALALGWSVNYATLPSAISPQPTTLARAWLTQHLPAGQQVLSDRRTRVALVPGTGGWDRVSTVDACRRTASLPSAARPLRGCARAPWWITDPTVPSGLPKHSNLIAVFGQPNAPNRIEVRTTSPTRQALAAELDARRIGNSSADQTVDMVPVTARPN